MTQQYPTPASPLRIGTRGSPLALAQAYETRTRLSQAFDIAEEAFEIVVIKTTGDKVLDRPLKEIGGKGLFTREIEDDMLSGKIDIAVHSMKDMPVLQPDGLVLETYLPREDVRDAFVSLHHDDLASLPAGALVGSSSLRRKAQLTHRRPDLEVVEFRVNVQTRLKKLEAGVASCTFLAMAGLNRLNLSHLAKSALDVSDVLPAGAQGAIGIECRQGDSNTEALLEPLHDQRTARAVTAERKISTALAANCHLPIAAHATESDAEINLRALVGSLDGKQIIRACHSGAIQQMEQISQQVAADLISQGALELMAAVPD